MAQRKLISLLLLIASEFIPFTHGDSTSGIYRPTENILVNEGLSFGTRCGVKVKAPNKIKDVVEGVVWYQNINCGRKPIHTERTADYAHIMRVEDDQQIVLTLDIRRVTQSTDYTCSIKYKNGTEEAHEVGVMVVPKKHRSLDREPAPYHFIHPVQHGPIARNGSVKWICGVREILRNPDFFTGSVITWFKETEGVLKTLTGEGTRTLKEDEDECQRTLSLTMTNLQDNDSGIYHCQVTTSHRIYRHRVKLNVIPASEHLSCRYVPAYTILDEKDPDLNLFWQYHGDKVV